MVTLTPPKPTATAAAVTAPSSPRTPRVAAQRPAPPPQTTKTTPRWLRLWVAGDVPGINHGQTGMGKGRHLTEKARAWAQKVEAAVAQARAQTEASLWRPAGGPMGVRMHFYVTAKTLKSGAIRKLDVDAPVKLTLDHTLNALGLDDGLVRALNVWQSVIEDAPRVGGYGKTRQGAWIEVWQLSAAEARRIDAEAPGEPG